MTYYNDSLYKVIVILLIDLIFPAQAFMMMYL